MCDRTEMCDRTDTSPDRDVTHEDPDGEHRITRRAGKGGGLEESDEEDGPVGLVASLDHHLAMGSALHQETPTRFTPPRFITDESAQTQRRNSDDRSVTSEKRARPGSGAGISLLARSRGCDQEFGYLGAGFL
jgi:hypothetical protein